MAGRWRRRLRRRRRIGAGKTWRSFAWSGCRSGPRRTSRAANAGLATAVDGRQFMVAGPCGWGAETRVLGDGEADSPLRKAGGQRMREQGKRSPIRVRSEEHTSELQSQSNLVCRLLLEKKK